MARGARIGTEFAGYRIEAVVGRGGSSIVYRAEYPRLGIPVALKLLNADAAEDESFRERFVRESRLAAAINHPNIITIYDAGVWEDTLYIALRFVAGGDLRARLRSGPLDAERVVAFAAQAASGLDAAHAHALVHRDVKPANIMVDAGPAGQGPEIVYVTDFGLVKRVQSGGRPTPTGDFLGTIDYVAPEQIEGRPVDGRADVYSLGCVIFECLAGRPPFERESDAAILWAHMQEEPPRISTLNPALPHAVDDVLARALAKDPEDRHQTCGALVAALAEAASGGDGSARTTVREASPRPSRRRLANAAAAAAAFTLGAVGAAVAVLAIDDDEVVPAGVVTRAAAPRVETRVVTESAADAEPAAYLLGSIPEQFRRSCRRTTPVSAEFWSTYACRPRRGPTIVRFSYARSGPLLGQYFQRRYVRAGLPRPEAGGRIPVTGTCAAPDLVALEEWDWSGAAGHHLVGQTPYGNTDGRVLCVRGGERLRPRIEWTTNVAGIYAHAEGRNYPALLAWWLDTGGPIR